MLRISLIAGVSLGLHILLFFLLDGYRELALRIGLIFPHGHDIADIFPVMGTGFAIMAAVVVGTGVLLDRLVHRSW
jgi:hypothetical protein